MTCKGGWASGKGLQQREAASFSWKQWICTESRYGVIYLKISFTWHSSNSLWGILGIPEEDRMFSRRAGLRMERLSEKHGLFWCWRQRNMQGSSHKAPNYRPTANEAASHMGSFSSFGPRWAATGMQCSLSGSQSQSWNTEASSPVSETRAALSKGGSDGATPHRVPLLSPSPFTLL